MADTSEAILIAFCDQRKGGVTIFEMVASMFTAAADALAAAVVELRTRAKLTQRQLADAVGREQSFIGRIETGQRRVDLVEWVTICRACGVDPATEIASLVRQIVPLVPARRRGK